MKITTIIIFLILATSATALNDCYSLPPTHFKLCSDGMIRTQSTNYEVMHVDLLTEHCLSQNKAKQDNCNSWMQILAPYTK